MKKKQPPEKFRKSIERITQLLVAHIGQGLKETKYGLKGQDWDSAWVDRRGDINAAIISKLRIHMSDGTIFARLQTPSEVDDLFDEIWRSKDALFSNPWHGLKLTVTPTGKYETAFDYDPTCAEDPTFWNPS